MIEVIGLCKKYKSSKAYSVRNVTFNVNDGEIFGFLGKNGAGKSTTIKCLTGILPPTSGIIRINGYDLATHSIEAKMNIGYVPDNHAVYDSLTGREYVNFVGNIYGVEKSKISERIDMFANLFSMNHALDVQIRSYSHGMKQKICIIAALIHNPKYWVLDEPLMGLDPQSAYEIKQHMLRHKEQGNSVLFSSHSIDIVEKICDRVAIISKGKLLEIVDMKTFAQDHDMSLEEYFLNKVKD